jgi:hypothetical protein
MINRDMLIVALESAENENREIEFSYTSNDGVCVNITMVPEVLVNGDEIQILDMEKGTGCAIFINLGGLIDFYADENKFAVEGAFGEYAIYI